MERQSAKQQLEDASRQQRVGLVVEFWDFLVHNKKWWIAPIVIVLLLFSLLIILGGSGAAPFIYSLI